MIFIFLFFFAFFSLLCARSETVIIHHLKRENNKTMTTTTIERDHAGDFDYHKEKKGKEIGEEKNEKKRKE